MKRRNLIISILAFLIISIVILGGFSNGVLANNVIFSLNKQFSDHTYVGPFNISNNKTKQAKSKIASDLTELQKKLDLNLIYQDTQFSLPPETVTFDIDMTLANANSGEDNPLIATVLRDGLQTVLSQKIPGIQFSEDAIDSIAIGIEKELQTGIMPRNVHITDYLGAAEIEHEIIASSEYSIDGISPVLSKAINALDKTVIQSFESFSMMELLTNPEIGPLTDEEMTFLSSILYTAILQTNFQVDERNISTALTSDIQPGFEAAMNQTLRLDFKFTNPNKSEFTIRSDWSAGAIHLTIEGQPFYYTYEPSITNIETYKPKTVRQYSAFVNDGQVIVSQEGKEGIEAIVKRTLSADGKVVDIEGISEDFYAPVNRIELHPLTKGNDTATENADSEEVKLPQNEGTQSDTGSKTSNTGEVEPSSSNIVDETGNAESTEGEILYDKSGLPISGK